jgi:pimeloyl-ACP methyl ester carboxylesterase
MHASTATPPRSRLHVVARASVAGVAIDYELSGPESGQDLVLIHAGCLGKEWFDPLLAEGTLLRSYRVLRFDRPGYGGSDPVEGPLDMAAHARIVRELMREVGMARAHVLGHSSSAMMSLQLALDEPDAVRTLALLDSARPAPPTELQAGFVRDVAGPAVERFRAGDPAGAMDTWLRGTCGDGWRAVVERTLPAGTIDAAVANAAVFFGQELPAVQAWTFGPEDAAQVQQPALLVLGERSAATFGQRRELLLEWLPNAEPFDLPGASHLMQLENARDLASALVAFHARHATA